eukprot:m51a1_g7932 hypothetical protein (699) ;mRNA; f:50325-53217
MQRLPCVWFVLGSARQSFGLRGGRVYVPSVLRHFGVRGVLVGGVPLDMAPDGLSRITFEPGADVALSVAPQQAMEEAYVDTLAQSVTLGDVVFPWDSDRVLSAEAEQKAVLGRFHKVPLLPYIFQPHVVSLPLLGLGPAGQAPKEVLLEDGSVRRLDELVQPGLVTRIVGMPGVGMTASAVSLAGDSRVFVLYFLCSSRFAVAEDSDFDVDAGFLRMAGDAHTCFESCYEPPMPASADDYIERDRRAKRACRCCVLREVICRLVFLLRLLLHAPQLSPYEHLLIQVRAKRQGSAGQAHHVEDRELLLLPALQLWELLTGRHRGALNVVVKLMQTRDRPEYSKAVMLKAAMIAAISRSAEKLRKWLQTQLSWDRTSALYDLFVQLVIAAENSGDGHTVQFTANKSIDLVNMSLCSLVRRSTEQFTYRLSEPLVVRVLRSILNEDTTFRQFFRALEGFVGITCSTDSGNGAIKMVEKVISAALSVWGSYGLKLAQLPWIREPIQRQITLSRTALPHASEASEASELPVPAQLPSWLNDVEFAVEDQPGVPELPAVDFALRPVLNCLYSPLNANGVEWLWLGRRISIPHEVVTLCFGVRVRSRDSWLPSEHNGNLLSMIDGETMQSWKASGSFPVRALRVLIDLSGSPEDSTSSLFREEEHLAVVIDRRDIELLLPDGLVPGLDMQRLCGLLEWLSSSVSH